jgi:hypothetical protein
MLILPPCKVDGGVLGQDGDAALPLQFVRIHHPVGHLLVRAKGSRLAQHGVHERCLAMVDMGDDGDIAYRLSHREFFSFLFGPPFVETGRRWVGSATAANRHTMRQFPFYQQRKKLSRAKPF